MSVIRSIIPYISYLWVLIVALTVWAWYYIDKQKKNSTLTSKRHWIDMMPSAISTLGVLVTFLGITLGLLCFDAKHLPTSIPQLLEGLKTAFFTSLAGMIGSLILSKKINNLSDEETGGVSDINQAAGLICKSVSDFQKKSTMQDEIQSAFYNTTLVIIQKMDSSIDSMTASIKELAVTNNNIATNLQEINKKTSSIAETAENIKSGIINTNETTNSIANSLGNIEENTNTNTGLFKDIHSHVGEITDHTDAIVSTESEMSEKITGLTDRLHGEVLEIEDKMKETNGLLERKFDEFSELLKKNNTEALVEVMKRVTEEFQTQMNSLISKLVKENFDQLNKSVEKLNVWQQENKEMISSLTSQYKIMADNFENTSTSLTKVKDDTQALVSDGGKLEQLINSLSEVIIQDQKFKEISSNLQQTADLSKSNMESFDKSTRQLNEWVRKQRDFNDAVAVLLQKLEEINEMRNYASEFWKETKSGMNDAVGIVKNGTNELNRQISNLDQQFYSRLSTTLAQLDACIQSLITNANNRR